MNDYEAARSRKIAQNQALVRDLGLQSAARPVSRKRSSRAPPIKKRKLLVSQEPTRFSSRLAAAPEKPSYDEDAPITDRSALKNASRRLTGKGGRGPRESPKVSEAPARSDPPEGIDEMRAGWTAWIPTASPPTRHDTARTFHFISHPSFTPNKSPEEMLREGCFGGSYFRPLYSAKLRITVEDDWVELPAGWIEGLNVDRYLTSPTYDPEVNKYKVSCGQSIEEWERNGWIDHQYDVRGWFQWYCRFFVGRRCEDDERQISRWSRCVGDRGRWRRALLKQYGRLGIRDVMNFGEEDEEDAPDVSPVVSQTCHHWAFEVRQDVLDDYWNGGTAA